MELSTRRVEAADVVEVKGEVDVSTMTELETFVSDLDAQELVLDMIGVDFMDTTGVRFLIGMANRFESEGRVIRLVLKDQSPVLLLLKLTGLSDQFIITQPGVGTAGGAF